MMSNNWTLGKREVARVMDQDQAGAHFATGGDDRHYSSWANSRSFAGGESLYVMHRCMYNLTIRQPPLLSPIASGSTGGTVSGDYDRGLLHVHAAANSDAAGGAIYVRAPCTVRPHHAGRSLTRP